MKTSFTFTSALLLLAGPVLSAYLVGCGDAEPRGCFFDGRYEMGYLAYESPLNCTSNSFTFFTTVEDECSSSIEQRGPTGAWQSGFVSCDPGNPVVECEGYMSDTDGCQWQLYIRRIE